MENILTFKSIPQYARFEVLSCGEKRRACKEDDDHIFVFGKGMRSRGTRYTIEQAAKCLTPLLKTAEELDKSWHKRLNKAIRAMDESGLWKDSSMYRSFQNLNQMNYSDKKKISDLYWESVYVNGMRKLDWEALAPYVEKYPFIVSGEGKDRWINTEYIFELSECKTKTMNFGCSNKWRKEQIRQAIEGKQNLSFRADNGYDVSFEMNFDTKDGIPRAWYSEEYRNCGNGHYYLCLGKIALFCEDD